MKSKLFVFSVILLFILPFYSFAGEGSDTIGACKILPQLRYAYTDNNFDSENWEIPDVDNIVSGKYISHSAYLQVDLGTCDYFDIYGLIGVNFINPETGWWEEEGINTLKFDYDPGFLFGLGIKGTFFRADNGFYVGAGVLFTHMSAKVDWWESDANGIRYGWGDGKLTENNFYADLHTGWHFKNIGLTPYVGVEFRQVWAQLDLTGISNIPTEFENHHPIGVYAGLDYFINDRLYLNVEGHAIDRWGVNAGIGYLFDICGKPAPVVAPVIPESEPVLTPMK